LSEVFRLAWRVLAPRDRRRALVLLAMLLVATGLETLGIGLLVPLLGVLVDPAILRQFPVVSGWLPDGELRVSAGAATLAGAAVVAFYLAKAAYLAWVVRRQMGFAFGVQADVSSRVFQSCLARPYSFHASTNSARLISTSLGEVQVFANGVLISGISLIAELLVLLSVSTLLIAIEPVAALASAAVLGLVAGGFYALIRRRLRLWGERRPILEALRLQHLQQGLSSVKEVLLSGREAEFVRRYNESNRGVAAIMQREKSLAQVPRFGLEVFAVLSVVFIVVFLLGQGRDPQEVVPRVAVFTAACFRIVPSLNRISNALQSLRFAAPAAAAVEAELSGGSKLLPPPPDPLAWRESIQMRGVSFRYVEGAESVLRSVDLIIKRGDRIGIVGPSGSGKSTLVNVLIGLLEPTDGAIEVDGTDIRTCIREWRAQVGYVPQSIVLSDDTLLRNIAFGEADATIDEVRVDEVLRLARLGPWVDAQPAGLRARPGERGARLSGGQLQRIGIARALYRSPSLLVLDEATSALDEGTESEVLDAITRLPRDITVVVITHRPSALVVCDRVISVEGGCVREFPATTADSIGVPEVKRA
jgi:ABC-type multidrug transport system fused ATPase/permease subunit